MNQKTRVAIGLGSNLGDRAEMLRRAASLIAEDVLENAVTSQIYETPPWGVLDQPLFLNAVIVGWSEWLPPSLVAYLKNLEKTLGRQPGIRFGPRLIDLDLLVFGETIWKSDGVTVPHPRLMEREFALRPLAELWPDWRHPTDRITAREGWKLIRDTAHDSARDYGPLPLSTGNR
jgi:2-amino-4-hydroxy-6-hydroxymethyldihydropteridine diphosphokinase